MAVLDERDASLSIQIKNQESTLAQMEEELKGFSQALEAGEQEKSRLEGDLDEARKEQNQAQAGIYWKTEGTRCSPSRNFTS